VLKTENASDPRLSTVRRYVEGMGSLEGQPADLRLVAVIGDSETEISVPGADSRKAPLDQVDTKEREVVRISVAPPADEGRAAWRLRAWGDSSLEAAWYERGIISVSTDEVGDLTTWPGDEALASRLAAAHPTRGQQAIGLFVTYWRYFRLEMVPGDIVVTPLTRKRAGVAVVTGHYNHDADDPEPRLRHHRRVEWLRTMPRSDLDEDIRRVVNAPGTICRIGAPGAAVRLR